MSKITTWGGRHLRGNAASAILVLMGGLSASLAGPPGVPTTPGLPEKSDPPSSRISPADEMVTLIDLRELPAPLATILQSPESLFAAWNPSPAVRDRLELRSRSHWLVAVGATDAIEDLRGWIATALSSATPPIEVEVQMLALPREDANTEEILLDIRREPSGDTVQSLAASPPTNIRVLAEGRATIGPGGSERLVWNLPDGLSAFVELGIAKTESDRKIDLRLDAEAYTEQTLGRRKNRKGVRATDRRRSTTLGRAAATTTAPFADTTIRLIDGSLKTLPVGSSDEGPPIIVVATPRIGTTEGLETALPTTPYIEGTPSRDGIGRRYFGREIAQVMGHLGAAWLERPEREREERTELLLSLLPVEPGDVVADIGAGSGYFTRRLARMVTEDGQVLATDIQPEMLEILEARLTEEGITNVDPILGTVTDSGLRPESVDLILLVDVYHEFDHPWEMTRSMRRALRPGGRVALVEYRANDPKVPIKPLHTMTAEQSRLEFEAAGFRLEREVVGDLPWQRLQLFVRDE